MKTLANNSSHSTTPASSPSTGTHWLWWLFLLGVLSFAAMGPTCAWH